MQQSNTEYGQYVLVNEQRGIIQWYENHDTAVQDNKHIGGIIINTATADPEFVRRTLADARKNM